MPIDQIKKEIIERGNSEIDSLKKDYETKLSSVSEKMQKKMADLDQKYTRMIDDDSKLKMKTILDSATLEAKRIIDAKTGELLEDGLSSISDQIKSVRESPDYAKILNKMVLTAGIMLGNDCTLYLRKADITKISNKSGLRIVEDNLDGHGGILARSKDGKIELDLTLSAIFNRVKEKLIQEIYERIG